MGAEQRPSSQLSVCLHSRAAAASTSVAPSGSPLTPTTHPQLLALPPSLLSPIFLFTCGSLQQPGSLLVRRTKMEGIEGGMDGGREGGG